MKIEGEEKVIFLQASLPPLYDHLVNIIIHLTIFFLIGGVFKMPHIVDFFQCMVKKIWSWKIKVSGTLLSHKTRRKLVIGQMGLCLALSQSVEKISLRRIMAQIESLGLSHIQQMTKNLTEMQNMWSAISVIRNGTTKDFVGR